MFVDASALTAILTDETDAAALAARLQRALRRVTSPLAVWETGVAVARHLDLPVPAEAEAGALDAYDRFGKGRHPAGLNFGDCFAYALSKKSGEPLLFVGDDFSQTDVQPVMLGTAAN